MNMKQIAALAGVSVSTVSKAFSGSREIGEETRNKIFDIAKANNSYTKYVKTSGYDYIIAVVCPEFQSGYYTQQLTYFEEEIKKRNGLLITAQSNFSREEQEKIISYFALNLKADGIILYADNYDENEYNIPAVSIGKTIRLSNQNGMNEAIAHLKENGHTKISYIGEPLAAHNYDYFKKAMNTYNMQINEKYILHTVNARFELSGYQAMNELLDLDDPPTAVITAYDYIAFGAMKAIYERGLKIPEDISIIGRDDVKECDYINIPLTTITPYSRDLCEIIVEELFDKINNNEKPKKDTKTINVSYQLLKRGTVGKVKHNEKEQ